MYNLTNLTDAGNVYNLVHFGNEVSNGSFVGMMMVSIFFVLLFGLKRYDFDMAFFASSFICFILSLILSFTGLLLFSWVLVFLITSALAGLYMYASK